MTTRIPADRFVAVWQAADSPAEVAAELGMLLSSAYSRAYELRRRGVVLKTFPRGRPVGLRQRADRISAETFARTWQAAACVSEAAKTLGITPEYARSRAAVLRRRGVRLKLFAEVIDVGRLNAIIKEVGA